MGWDSLDGIPFQLLPLEYLGIRSSDFNHFGYLEPVGCETDTFKCGSIPRASIGKSWDPLAT